MAIHIITKVLRQALSTLSRAPVKSLSQATPSPASLHSSPVFVTTPLVCILCGHRTGKLDGFRHPDDLRPIWGVCDACWAAEGAQRQSAHGHVEPDVRTVCTDYDEDWTTACSCGKLLLVNGNSCRDGEDGMELHAVSMCRTVTPPTRKRRKEDWITPADPAYYGRDPRD